MDQSFERRGEWTEQLATLRRLIAYEIHDGFVQDATGAMMHLETLLQTGQVPSGRVRNEIKLALELIRKAVTEARQLVHGLRPPVLEELGIVAAVEQLIDDQPPGGPSIQFEADVQSERLPPLLEIAIYRVIQESLTNIRRHSKSDRATIRLTQSGDYVHVDIRDWGIGFDPDDVQGERFGLRGIRERARLLGGQAVIESAPGLGTRVVVDIPLAGVPQDVAAT